MRLVFGVIVMSLRDSPTRHLANNQVGSTLPLVLTINVVFAVLGALTSVDSCVWWRIPAFLMGDTSNLNYPSGVMRRRRALRFEVNKCTRRRSCDTMWILKAVEPQDSPVAIGSASAERS